MLVMTQYKYFEAHIPCMSYLQLLDNQQLLNYRLSQQS